MSEVEAIGLKPVEETGKGTAAPKGPYPPYNCSPSWVKKFFDLAKTMKIQTFDIAFVRNYIVGSKNETKLVNAVRFLQLIDEKGRPTDKFSLLSSEKDVFKQNLSKIVGEAYSDLMTNVKIHEAGPDLLYGYFTDPKRWRFTLEQAKRATKFFVWLAKEANIELSSKLTAEFGVKLGEKPRELRLKKESTSKEETPAEETKQVVKVTKSQVVSSGAGGLPTASIQASITMSLDKDTPLEVWRMVMRFLGLQTKEELGKSDGEYQASP